jgi:phosphoribosylamine-glycine ligase
MIAGTLKGIRFSAKASVVTCAVPRTYGVPDTYGERNGTDHDQKIDLRAAYQLERKYGGDLRIFPMDLRAEDGVTYLGTSRSVAVVGIGRSVEDAREVSLQGVGALNGPLRYRADIASTPDVARSRSHLIALRNAKMNARSRG